MACRATRLQTCLVNLRHLFCPQPSSATPRYPLPPGGPLTRFPYIGQVETQSRVASALWRKSRRTTRVTRSDDPRPISGSIHASNTVREWKGRRPAPCIQAPGLQETSGGRMTSSLVCCLPPSGSNPVKSSTKEPTSPAELCTRQRGQAQSHAIRRSLQRSRRRAWQAPRHHRGDDAARRVETRTAGS